MRAYNEQAAVALQVTPLVILLYIVFIKLRIFHCCVKFWPLFFLTEYIEVVVKVALIIGYC